MPYDYQLLAAVFIGVFGVLRTLAAVADQRSPAFGLIYVIVACGLGYWAYDIAGGDLTFQDIPEALFRVIGYWAS